MSRITVLIRAADLLWPYQQDKARTAFSDAFELATEHEKEAEQNAPRSLLMRLRFPDQRYVVIRAIAKRDPAWAKELTRQMLKKDREIAKDLFNDQLRAARLLEAANKLIDTDINAALELANTSLQYPASFMLTRFLYRLAEINQQAADELYGRALTVYANKPLREFLYLQAYPFGWRETLNTPVFSFYEDIPPKFVPNQNLQRRFLQLMLSRAEKVLEEPLDEGDAYRDPSGVVIPGAVHILHGLIKLEPHVRQSLIELLPALTVAREKILVSLSVETQKQFLQPGREASIPPGKTFDERIELAQKISDLNERDESIANAVFSSDKESLANVVQAIEKISDASLRASFLEWLYFQRASTAIEQRQFEEAERLTSKVEGLEQRAYLHVEIAKGLLKRTEMLMHTREVLDEAIREAKKAGATIFAARALLTASNLYSKIDFGHSISVLSDAINYINRIEVPNFVTDGQALENTPRRKGRFGRYKGEYVLRFYMPGLDPERAFREMAKIDADTAMNQSTALTDKFQRAMATLGLAEVCLDKHP
ncbi:MAG TPA: hypothetical protein VFR78_14330 [Pyrinomonadaceae bacterium]|nr:hypothetical protein [Pyrinomonadaceae bacterium]